VRTARYWRPCSSQYPHVRLLHHAVTGSPSATALPSVALVHVSLRRVIGYLSTLPTIDFTEEERRALADLAREYVRTQRYPLAPRLAPIKAALLKLAPADELPVGPLGGGSRRKPRR
jgi:hypothetical protein